MKINKVEGFTLIELLAVIVILAIIALIATPIVLNIINESKESAQLRSAEMYLDAVEQSIALEKMTNTTFNPNSCTIANGNLNCDSKDVEVKVNGEVPQTGKIIFENGKIKDIRLNYSNGKTIVKNSEDKLVYSSESENIEYIAYSVGDEVTIGTEKFYVIVSSDVTQEKVTLLAKNCINTTTLVQSADADKPAFSSIDYWSTIEGITYPYDLNDTPTSADTDVIAKARAYGTALGGTGRLMTKEEAEVLETANSDILYGRNGKSSNTYLNYCLGSARDTGLVWTVSGFNSGFYSVPFDVDNTYGIRPVVEISKKLL